MSSQVSRTEKNADAYGRRNRLRARARNTMRRVTRRLMWTFDKPFDPDVRFIPLPQLSDDSVSDFATRTTWYLGRWSRGVGGSTDEPQVPRYLDNTIDAVGSEQPSQSAGSVHHLVWKVTPRTYFSALVRPSSVTIVDPSFAKDVDSEGYLNTAKRLGRTVPAGFASPQLARATSDWKQASALSLGTGPSAGDVRGNHENWTYRIVCNSAIRDATLMRRLRPTHICFGDPVFHFGPSAYAGQFRADLRTVAEEYDSILVVPGYCAGLIATNMPWTRGRLLPLELDSKSWNAPTMESLTVRVTGNVMTQQMVPLAISLAEHVDIGGADGRKPDEKYFWTHSRTHQYSDDLMNTVFAAHPAFFRDTDYADYYAEHCAAFADLIAYGEARGRTFRTVTNSYIPALSTRMSSWPQADE